MDSIEKIQDILNAVEPLSNATIQLLLPIFNERKIKKNEVFVSVNSHNEFEYIIIDGICRSFIMDTKGNEATLSFFSDGSILPPNESRTVNNKSLMNIQALTDTNLIYFSRQQFAELMIQNMELARWGKSVYDDVLIHITQKELSLLTMTAAERLERFREKFPKLENLVSHAHIASYLGISNVSLSRLRSQLK